MVVFFLTSLPGRWGPELRLAVLRSRFLEIRLLSALILWIKQKVLSFGLCEGKPFRDTSVYLPALGDPAD